MKTIEFYRRTEKELRRLTDCICRCCHPNAVILFGEYAKGLMCNARTGYELFIITDSGHGAEDILAALSTEVKERNRYERRLTVYIHTSVEFITQCQFSYFIHTILCEGVLLYTDGTLDFDKYTKFYRKTFVRNTTLTTNRYLGEAGIYLDTARDYYKNLSFRLMAVNMDMAVERLFMAMEFSIFGFHRKYKNINDMYKWLLVMSKGFRIWNSEYVRSVGRSLTLIRRMAKCARYGLSYGYHKNEHYKSLEFLMALNDFIIKDCGDRLEFYRTITEKK